MVLTLSKPLPRTNLRPKNRELLATMFQFSIHLSPSSPTPKESGSALHLLILKVLVCHFFRSPCCHSYTLPNSCRHCPPCSISSNFLTSQTRPSSTPHPRSCRLGSIIRDQNWKKSRTRLEFTKTRVLSIRTTELRAYDYPVDGGGDFWCLFWWCLCFESAWVLSQEAIYGENGIEGVRADVVSNRTKQSMGRIQTSFPSTRYLAIPHCSRQSILRRHDKGGDYGHKKPQNRPSTLGGRRDCWFVVLPTSPFSNLTKITQVVASSSTTPSTHPNKPHQ